MNERFFLWPLCSTCAGALLGFVLSTKYGLQPVVVLAAIGCGVGTIGGGIVVGLHAGLGLDRGTTSVAGLAGAFLGAMTGGYLGVVTGFGTWMIATFNPRLPEMDFRDSFGAIGGVFIGAMVGACVMSGLVLFIKWRRCCKPAIESAGDD